jgi:Uma2 family endonuclease
MQMRVFYNRLPRNKIELVDGQTLISGSLRTSRMVLEAILEGYGPEYILPLVDQALLREACIEAFGRDPSPISHHYPEVAPTMPVARLASELMMSFHVLNRYGSLGRDVVVRLGEDAFTPDVYVYADSTDPRQGSYYFDGAPDLIIKVMHPANRAFDTGRRLSGYQAAQVPEIWLIDFEHETIRVYHRTSDAYAVRTVIAPEPLVSAVLPTLTLRTDRLWRVKADPWKNYFDLLTVERPFAPDIGLIPTSISFAQFIAWAPEAKFEWFDDCPHIGGGDETNLHITGLLLMTLGLTEAVGLLPAEAWTDYL